MEWNSPQTRTPRRPERFTADELPLSPGELECFDGPGGSVHFSEDGRTFAAYVLAGTRAPSRLVAEARAVLDTLRVEPAPRTLVRDGLSITAPPGWHGRMLFTDPAGAGRVIFQVANFELPPNERFEPPRELPPGEQDPIKAMSGDDVLVMVISGEAASRPARLPLSLDDLRFHPDGDPRIPSGHALASGSLCLGPTCIRIEVDFAGGRPGAALAAQADAVLASLAADCGRSDWPGPWTACAEAGWVARVVEEGGFRVVGETGSALVAEGRGRSFYVWTTRGGGDPEPWKRLAVVDGVPVYGDVDLWRWWTAQGLVVWIKQGPRADSITPSPSELGSLVRASRTVPAPSG